MIAPKGVAVPTEGGYLVSGQWPFASDGPDPDYVAGNCLLAAAALGEELSPMELF
jgi:alkylation response protein AidB-like acyl-CoA dehydrogenase